MPSASGAPSTPQNPRWKRLSIIGFTMIIVVIPFCLYFLFFVSSQRTYFSKRNFRVLAEIGDHMSSKIDNLATNLVNVAEKATQDKSDKAKVASEELSDKKNKGEQTAPITDARMVKEAASMVPDFKVEQVQYTPNETARTEQSNTVSPSQKTSTPRSKTHAPGRVAKPGEPCPGTAESTATGAEPVTLNVKPDKGSFWLYLQYRSASKTLPGMFSVMSNLETHFEPFVSRYVIDELNETNERLFDEVLVAEEKTGSVIFQRGPPGLNVAALDSLSNDKGGKLELSLVDQSSSLADVQVAGANYKLFLQPVRLTLSAGNDEKKQEIRWVLCGLTRTDHFRDATYAAPYTVLIFFVFVVLLAVLSWPLLKLKLMGPKDRLRGADLVLTLFSALMGTALVTFILLDVNTFYSLESTLDRHLKNLSKEINTNFQEEVGSALTQLQKLNDKITTAATEEKSGALRDLLDSRQSPAPNIESDVGCTPTLSRKRNILGDGVDWDYPYFNSATWTDSAGRQRIKWTTRSKTTAFVDVSEREFFKNTKNGTLWKLNPGSGFDYYLEMVKTKNTGENAAVIATRVPGSLWVSSLDTRLLSLMGPVLPPGYGYAVIDSGGEVLFHSDEVKNLEEQFFAECENDRRLRAAVLSRMDQPIDTNYLGKGHRMYVSALGGTPWTLVVFADKQMARTINLEVITLSIVLYLLFSLSVVALISLFCLARMIVFSGRYRPKDGDWTLWLWPHSKRAPHFELLIVFYVLAACIAAMAWIIGGSILVICCIGLPLLAAGLWWLILVWGPAVEAIEDESSSGKASDTTLYKNVRARLSKVCRTLYDSALKKANTKAISHLSYRTRYAIAFAGLLVLMSMVPAAGFFQIAHNFEMRLMVKHGQVSIAKALEQRKQRVASQYAAIQIGDQGEQAIGDSQRQAALQRAEEKKAAFLKQRLERSPTKSNLDVYDSFFFDTTHVDLPQPQFAAETPGGLDWLLLQVRPLYNQSCVESQGLAASASSDPRWKLDRESHILLGKDKDGREGDPSVALRSGIVGMATPGKFWSWVGVIALALLPLLIYGLVRFVARRFFLLDTDLPACDDFSGATKLAGSRVLVWFPMTANGNEWDPKKYYVTDLNPVNDWPGWREKLMSNSPKAGRSVVLNNFEHCMDNPAASREKLLAIEQLLKSERGVVVVSTVDPSSFSLALKSLGEVAGANGKLGSVPPESAVDGKQNGATDLRIESHSSGPSVAIEGKQNGADDVKSQAPAFCLPDDIQARWTALFTSLETDFVADKSTPEFVKDHSELIGILKTKAPWYYIQAIVTALPQNGTLTGMDWRNRAKIEELISQVVEQARSYHQALWDTCSEGQRCTLIQLAQHGMVSPKNKHLRRLVKRGLVVPDLGLRLMDESFRRFVLSVSHEEDIEAWRRQEGGSAWQLMRVPILLILVSVALFLFITQKDVYDSSISFMSAITAGIAALFKLLGMFQRDKGGASQS
jgi:hypothetical protein